MASIVFDDISFAYGNNQILKNFSLKVENSQILCLVGPSGCGKTTLLRCLLGFNKPSSGEIWIGDRCVFSRKKHINLPTENRRIGVVFQDYAVWPHMTVMENVSYPLKKRRVPKEDIPKRVEKALRQVHMEGYANYLPSQLSGGQQQRVAIARALISSDTVIVMDEPITNLDAKLREEMLVEIRQLQKNIGTTVLYITHDQEAALHLCDKMAVMNSRGELCQIGADEDIILRPASRFVFEFIGMSNFFTLVKEDNQWRFVDDKKFVFPGKVPEQFSEKKVADMGVRPNNIMFDPDSPIKGTVKRSVFLGSEYDYFVEFGGKEIRVQKNSFETLRTGESEKEGEIVGLKFVSPNFYPVKERNGVV